MCKHDLRTTHHTLEYTGWLDLQVMQMCRKLAGKDRERSHLLSLYGALCSCINSKEHRVREVVQDVLQLAGLEIGLIEVAPQK